jgi:hypothetical protein
MGECTIVQPTIMGKTQILGGEIGLYQEVKASQGSRVIKYMSSPFPLHMQARSELMGLQHLETLETSSPDNMFVRRTCLTKSNHIWVTMPPNSKFDSFEIRIYSGIGQKWSKWRYQWTLTTDQSMFLGFIILAHPCEKCAKKFMRFAGLAWILAIELVAISFSCFQSSQARQQLKTCLDSSRSPIVYVYMILYNIQWYISIIK